MFPISSATALTLVLPAGIGLSGGKIGKLGGRSWLFVLRNQEKPGK